MSGAEVLAVVGILANIAQVVDATVSVVKRVASFCNDVNELPNVLKQVQIVSRYLFLGFSDKQADR